MPVDNHTTIEKMDIDELIGDTLKIDYMISAPIEHYSTHELIEIAEKAKKNNLIVTIREERSNFYQGVLLNVIKRDCVNDTFLKHM